MNVPTSAKVAGTGVGVGLLSGAVAMMLADAGIRGFHLDVFEGLAILGMLAVIPGSLIVGELEERGILPRGDPSDSPSETTGQEDA